MGRRRRQRTVRPIRPRAGALAACMGLLRWRDWGPLGIPRSQVTASLTRVARGVYTDRAERAEASIIVAKRVERGVLSLLSAAHFHRLLEEPAEVWIALPRKARKPRVTSPPLRTVRFSGEALTEGVELHCRRGVPVRVYSVAKTVADLFRYRHKLGSRPAVRALRHALWLGCCSVELLRHFARVCRVEEVMEPYLEVAVRLPVLPPERRFIELGRCACHRRMPSGQLVPYPEEELRKRLYGVRRHHAAGQALPPGVQALLEAAAGPEEAPPAAPEPPRVLRLEVTP